MATPATHNDYVTVQEAAEMLRIHPETLRRRIRAGKLPAFRPSASKLLIRREDIQPVSAYPDRAEQAAARFEEFITKAVAAAPPLGPEQRTRLAALLNGGAAK